MEGKYPYQIEPNATAAVLAIDAKLQFFSVAGTKQKEEIIT